MPALILSPQKVLGFSTKRSTRPASSITTTPYLLGSSTCAPAPPHCHGSAQPHGAEAPCEGDLAEGLLEQLKL